MQKRVSNHRERAILGIKTKLYDYIRWLWKNGDDFEIKKVFEVPLRHWEWFEITTIKLYREHGYKLTNLANGGRAPTCTPEFCQRMSERCKGRTFSLETLRRMSEAKKGKTPWNKGIKTGQISPMKNPETVARAVATRRANGNYVTSEETREKMCKAKIGFIPWNKGMRKNG